MRLFIAIELPQDIKEGLMKMEDALKPHIADIKWVEKENFHITLRFLGEIEEALLKDVEVSVEETANNCSSFDISLSKIGTFPYVIWVGIDKGKEILADIARKLDESLVKYGFSPADKPFSPHITLGRSKRTIKKIPQVDIKALQFRAESVTIVKSTLLPRGPIYEPVRRFPFL
ncbi:MAG: RNA 2',3'-cyclic phosphodiesterase [bacterium]